MQEPETRKALNQEAAARPEPPASPPSSGMGGAIIADAVVMAIVMVAMYLVRFKSGLIGFRPESEGYRDLDYFIFLPCGVVLWVLAIYVVRGYEADARGWSGVALTRLVTGTVLALALIFVGDSLARHSIEEWWGVSRLFQIMTMLVGGAALAALRLITGKKQ